MVVTDVSAQGNIRRSRVNVIMALTCANAISRHSMHPADTGLTRLLICGFGVQVPGGAPPLTWPYAVSSRSARRTSWSQIGQMRARSEHGLHASTTTAGICWCQRRGPRARRPARGSPRPRSGAPADSRPVIAGSLAAATVHVEAKSDSDGGRDVLGRCREHAQQCTQEQSDGGHATFEANEDSAPAAEALGCSD